MRLAIYSLLQILGTVGIYILAILESQRAYEAGDKSAFAWHGFAPFIIPIFFIQAAMYLIPVIVITESIIYLKRKFQSPK